MKAIGNVIITGGSSGIGKYFIHQLRTLENRPLICNLSRSKPAENFINYPFYHLPCDLGQRNELEAAAEKLIELLQDRPGEILLINNSGFGAYGFFPTPGIEEHLDMIDVNVKAVVHLTSLLLPLLKKRGGAIVNIASTAAFQPTPYMATYGASKAFLLHWGLALGEELRKTGIQVLTICPGPTGTAFYRRAGFQEPVVPDAIGLSVEKVVADSLKALDKGKKLAVPGMLNKFLATTSSRLPKSLAARIGERLLRQYSRPKK
ncbi:MAG TPA: SDR family NAD(P)-dependent oxidoreductase [Opitutales bacterium]|nr:SDR family NAD(P)-dependent oxidoreductase [Opitutales bacterium]